MRPAPPSPFGIVPAEVAMDARLSLQQCQRALLRLDAMGLIARSRTSGTNERVARLLPAGDAALKGRP